MVEDLLRAIGELIEAILLALLDFLEGLGFGGDEEAG